MLFLSFLLLLNRQVCTRDLPFLPISREAEVKRFFVSVGASSRADDVSEIARIDGYRDIAIRKMTDRGSTASRDCIP